LPVIAFAKGSSDSEDAFVVTNMTERWDKPCIITITGTDATEFKAFRTSEDESEKYKEIGTFKVEDGKLLYDAPAGTVTTFFAVPNERGANNQRPRREIKWVNPDIKEMPGLSHHILQSKSLGHEVGYSVWTPPGYEKNTGKKYPVIYFLHGAGGNESADAAGFSDWAKKAIEAGNLPPVICVFPNGGMSGYRGEVETMIVDELISTMDKNYRTISKAKSRALAGFSMGGAGSVYLSIMHPELFCCAGSMGGGIGGRRSNPEYEAQINQAIEKAIPVWKKNKFGFFMVNGDNDRPDAFKDFSSKLNTEKIDNKVVVLPDTKHNLGLYYERSVMDLLAFLGKHLEN